MPDKTPISVCPDPCTQRAHIRVCVPGDWGSPASLKVYDKMGRMVRILAGADRPGALRDIVFDGRDDRGVGLALGVYFIRLQAHGHSASTRFVMLGGPAK